MCTCAVRQDVVEGREEVADYRATSHPAYFPLPEFWA